MIEPDINERLTRVGPGSSLGELMRQYWMPALLSAEVAEPDGPPKRLRLLGENLVAFRDTRGKIGILDEHCAHRRASLAFGRNEECGLRCLYHGWKFDVDGNVVDMPNEPETSKFRERVKTASCRTHEVGGVIWAYMGSDDPPPVLSVDHWNDLGSRHFSASRVLLSCNFLQGLEGGIDSSHAGILHQTTVRKHPNHPMTRSPLHGIESRDNAPRLEVELGPPGLRYAALRRVEGSDERYLRVTTYCFPWFATIPWPDGVPRMANAFVPIDDYHTWVWFFWYDKHDELDMPTLKAYSGLDDLDENFQPPRTFANDFLQDRTLMKAGDWSGIKGISSEDGCMQESQGRIADRGLERLGRADLAIIRMRRLILERIDLFERLGEVDRRDWDIPLRDEQSRACLVATGQEWQQLVDAKGG